MEYCIVIVDNDYDVDIKFFQGENVVFIEFFKVFVGVFIYYDIKIINFEEIVNFVGQFQCF